LLSSDTNSVFISDAMVSMSLARFSDAVRIALLRLWCSLNILTF
jgi:hypothetical protein